MLPDKVTTRMTSKWRPCGRLNIIRIRIARVPAKRTWHSMKRRFFISLILLSVCISAFGFHADGAEFRITKVYDGDTVKAEADDAVIYVMLVGIDAPEITTRSGPPGQPFGDEASRFLSHLVLNKLVEIKAYGHGPYPHDHILGEIHVRNVNVNLEMVRQGLAEVCSEGLPKGLDVASYLSAEDEARDHTRGIWSQGERYESPAGWREKVRLRR